MKLDGWILTREFCAKYQIAQAVVLRRVRLGYWPRGVIYSVPDGGRSYIHEERAREWLIQKGKPVPSPGLE